MGVLSADTGNNSDSNDGLSTPKVAPWYQLRRWYVTQTVTRVWREVWTVPRDAAPTNQAELRALLRRIKPCSCTSGGCSTCETLFEDVNRFPS